MWGGEGRVCDWLLAGACVVGQWVWRGIVPIRGAGETGCAVPSAEKTGNGGVATP